MDENEDHVFQAKLGIEVSKEYSHKHDELEYLKSWVLLKKSLS